jgi:phytoene desaturase
LNQHVSKHFKQLPLQQILEYPAVFLGASPFQAPAIYHLMSTLDFTQGVYYPDGGLYGIAQSLQQVAEKQGVRFHFDAPVEAINAKDGKAHGLTVAGQRIAADLVISNADRHFTETILTPEQYRTYPEAAWRRKTSGPSALLLYLGVKGALPQLQHHNLFFTEAWRQNFDDIFVHKRWPKRPSMYVCKPSAHDPSVAPKGHENVFVLVPLPAGVQAHDDDHAYARHCLDEIAQQAGIPDLHQRIVNQTMFQPGDFASTFNAWQGSALGLSHVLSQSAMFRPANRSRKLPGLYYVGGDTRPGIGLPMCLISAQLVYKYLTNDHSSGLLTTLHRPKDGWSV